jgi:hypothetical protein
MNIFAHDGDCLFTGIWTAITASKSFDANLLSIPKGATHFVRYTTGTDFSLVAGETVTGAAASAVVVAVVLETGAISSDTAAGILFLKTVSGAFAAETITGGTSTGTVLIAQDLVKLSPHTANPNPKALLVAVETAAIKCTVSGIEPTATAGTNFGVHMDAGQSRVIRGINNIKNFKAINAVASNGAILKWELYF